LTDGYVPISRALLLLRHTVVLAIAPSGPNLLLLLFTKNTPLYLLLLLRPLVAM
jgi:hypothetical protein